MLPLPDFKDYIIQNALFTDQHKILLTVSGGRDSVLMAHLFKLSGYDFGIAHCNFNLRADESQRDESFVRMLAATLGVPFHVIHFQTKAYAGEHNISVQMAARELRYSWFEQIRIAQGYDLIAVAQHKDDAIETVLLNLTRGTGIAGLHGIFPKRGKLVRPMLFLSRQQIDQLIEANNIDYVEDSSNLSANYARNKIRLKVIPQLKEINPNFGETFEHNIQRFADTELVLQNVITTLKQELFVDKQGVIHLSIAKVKALNPIRLLLFELLRPFGFSEYTLADLTAALDKQSGTSFYSTSHRIIIDREDLIISRLDLQEQPLVFIHDQTTVVPFFNHKLLISYADVPFFEKSDHKAFIDADKLIFPLVVRSRQEGDRFIPLGMKTFKKLSNFLIDEKIPLSEKDQIPLVLNGNGEIIWIAGWRQDNRYKITRATKKTAIFELVPAR